MLTNQLTATTEVAPNSGPVLGTLQALGSFVDNSVTASCEKLGFSEILRSQGIKKKLGAGVIPIFLVILISPIVKAQSLWAFCEDFLDRLSIGSKDVIYRFLTREDIKWAVLLQRLARSFVRFHSNFFMESDSDRFALVVDDSLKERSGKVEGSASHWDHNKNQAVRSQQVLMLGLAFKQGFVPLLTQICTGKKRRQERSKPFKDGRSEVAKAYRRGIEEDKNAILATMLKKITRLLGIKIKWLLGDSWYGTKGNIKTAIDLGLECIFLMKKSRLKYRFQGRLFTAQELYECWKRKMKPLAGGRFRGVMLKVEINLGNDQDPKWQGVSLMFSRPKHNKSQDGWVVCLCSDKKIDMEKILEIYSMRWSIEVFFKECKQNLAWLNNQSKDYVGSDASLHLSAIRYILLLDGALEGAQNLSELRKVQNKTLTLLCYMGLLWELFTNLVFGMLEELKKQFGTELIAEIRASLEEKLDEFIKTAFQVDQNSIESAY